jgi:hypothetical protein
MVARLVGLGCADCLLFVFLCRYVAGGVVTMDLRKGTVIWSEQLDLTTGSVPLRLSLIGACSPLPFLCAQSESFRW